MSEEKKASIIALGSYLPKNILSNADLEKMVVTSDDWIVSRTGMRERRIASKEETPSEMGSVAAKQALEKAGLEASAVDCIVVATSTPDYLMPNTASLIQHKIGAKGAAALDVQTACSGFLYGLSVANAFVKSGTYKTVLFVATEKMSSIIDYTDRSTCILFGDGAAAAVISSEERGFLIDNVVLGADGSLAEILMIPAGGAKQPATEETVAEKLHAIRMSGREVFRHAVKRMIQAAKESLDKAGLTKDELIWVVPHQANERIIDAIGKQFSLPEEAIYKTVHKYGNTSASSVAIALAELEEEHKIPKGAHMLLIAFGAGLTWGASILTKR